MNTENKRTFDPTNSFTFFGTWAQSIEALETEQDRASNAYMLFKAIADYSMYDVTPGFDNPILNAVWTVIEREIDISIGKRKRNFADDEMNKKHKAIIEALIANPTLSLRAIGELTGTDKNMVDRVRHKYSEQINKAVADNVTDIGTDNDINTDIDTDNDTMGRDRDGTAGQSNFIQEENNINPLTCSLSDWNNLTEDERKEFTLLDRIHARLLSGNCLEVLSNNKGEDVSRAKGVKNKWDALYKLWQRSITNESVQSIIEKYLSTHTETKELKRLGDKYGRIIDGWNEERQEPNIVYSVNGYFPQGIRHNIADIPIDYYRASDEVTTIEEEEDALRGWVSEHGNIELNDYDLPF